MKTSYSQNNTYIMCPKMWYWQYVEGWESSVEGSSLYFGTAIDRAASDILENKPDWLQKFYNNWEFQGKNGQIVRILDNDNIAYSHRDFDPDLLEPKDQATLEQWAKELNLVQAGATPTLVDLIALYKRASKDKSNPYVKITDEQLKYFNRCSWLGLKRKGKLLLEAFNRQVVPKVKKVHSLQKRCKIEDPNTGDQIIGYIDMVLELDGYDKPIIFDLKTASMSYDQHQVDVSPQLTLYSAMESLNYNTDLVGYIVLCKNIQKDTISHCKTCGNKKSTRHKTCDALINGNRCGGDWLESKVPMPQVQIMVEKKSQEQINDLLLDVGNIILAMKNQVVYKNTNRCLDHFGGPCPFYGLCHKNDSTGLTKKNRRGTT